MADDLKGKMPLLEASRSSAFGTNSKKAMKRPENYHMIGPNTRSFPPDFSEFIRQLLVITPLKDSEITEVISVKKYMDVFEKAFIHPSLSIGIDYERLEIYGDTAVNHAINRHVFYRYPNLKEDLLTRIQQIIKSTKILSKLATDNGFEKWVKYGPIMNIHFQKRDSKFLHCMEDVLESFFGALNLVLDEYKGYGFGIVCTMKIVDNFLNKEVFPTKYEDLYDAKTRLKEIYDVRRWPFKQWFEYNKALGCFIITAAPRGMPEIILREEFFSKDEEVRKKKAMELAERAIGVLRGFNIYKLRE